MWKDESVKKRVQSSFSAVWNQTPKDAFPLDAIQLFIKWHCCSFLWNVNFAENLMHPRELNEVHSPTSPLKLSTESPSEKGTPDPKTSGFSLDMGQKMQSAMSSDSNPPKLLHSVSAPIEANLGGGGVSHQTNPFASYAPNMPAKPVPSNVGLIEGAQVVFAEGEEDENEQMTPANMINYHLDLLQSATPDSVSKSDLAHLTSACIVIDLQAQNYSFETLYPHLSGHEDLHPQAGKEQRRDLLLGLCKDNFKSPLSLEEAQCVVFYYHLLRKDDRLQAQPKLGLSDYWRHHIRYAGHSGADLHSHILRKELLLKRCVEVHIEERASFVGFG